MTAPKGAENHSMLPNLVSHTLKTAVNILNLGCPYRYEFTNTRFTNLFSMSI